MFDQLRERVGSLDFVNAWAARTAKEIGAEPFQLDKDFVGRLLPYLRLWVRWFDAEIAGFERLPPKGQMLLVGNHSGGALTPDTGALLWHWYQQRGLDDPLIGLAFDAAFGVPGFNTLMRKIGQAPASRENALAALAAGRALLVYPGGAHEVFRPWKDRNRITFGGRKGFIKIALKSGAPVVPVVGHGGHESIMVLSRGEWLRTLTGIDRIRVEGAPIIVQFPWGISTPLITGVPMPAKIHLSLLDPLDWSHLGPESAEDPAVLDRCYEEITTLMQDELSRLAAANPQPLLQRLKGVFGG